MPETLVDCVLECGHARQVTASTFIAAQFNEALCPRCGTVKLVIEWVQHDRGYGFRCQDCRYARYFANAKVTRDVKAASHSVRKQHDVTLLHNGKPEAFQPKPLLRENQLALSLDSPPPF